MIPEVRVEIKQKPLILIIDKDTTHTEKLREGLELQGFRVMGAFLQPDTEELVMSAKPNIVCMDPSDLGFGVRRLREVTSVPIIVLSESRPLLDRLNAYREGADLYLTKSASEGYEDGSNSDVLASFARRILSKSESNAKRVQQPPFSLQYENGLLIDVLDAEKCAVFRYGAPIYMWPPQTRLFALLATEPGKIFTYREILTKYRGVADSETRTLLRMDISRLRTRLGSDGDLIKTAAGIGYYLLPPSEEFTLKESVLFDQDNLSIAESGRVQLDGNYLNLSDPERRILMILVLNSGTDVPADALLSKGASNVHTVKNQVLRLRKKLGPGFKFIRNVPGGYMFD